MTGKQLKNSILQLAIQGKLVPQDPNDEPSSKLLERIRKEKEQLVKEGKLKKKDLVSEPITDEDKPFEIPESWEWCRLKEVFTMQAGKNINASELSQEKNETHEYLCYGGNGIRGYIGKYNYDGVYPIVGRQGALCGCVNMANGKFQATEHAVVVTTYAKTNELWAYYFLIACNLNQYATATAQPGLSVENILETLIPLPPLSEQHRIVAKIEELMPLVEEYDKAQTKLNDLNEKLPDALKKSILQEAIQGKLVPQDPNDEPASKLLERIRKEKEQLVKEGKLKKKDLVSEPIADEEKPFEIPESWEWCRLFALVDADCSLGYGIVQPMKDIPNGIPIVRPVDMNHHWVTRLGLKRVDPKISDAYQRTILRGGEILFCVRGTVGKISIATPELAGANVTRGISPIRISNKDTLKYVFYVLSSPETKDKIKEFTKGAALQQINVADLKNILIPIPPLSEQHRIVAKIEELFGTLK